MFGGAKIIYRIKEAQYPYDCRYQEGCFDYQNINNTGSSTEFPGGIFWEYTDNMPESRGTILPIIVARTADKMASYCQYADPRRYIDAEHNQRFIP